MNERLKTTSNLYLHALLILVFAFALALTPQAVFAEEVGEDDQAVVAAESSAPAVSDESQDEAEASSEDEQQPTADDQTPSTPAENPADDEQPETQDEDDATDVTDTTDPAMTADDPDESSATDPAVDVADDAAADESDTPTAAPLASPAKAAASNTGAAAAAAPAATQAAAPAASTSSAAAASTQTVKKGPIADGTYVIETAIALLQVLDAKDGKAANGTNAQTWSYNGSNAQKWVLTYNPTADAYTITLYGTNGKYALDLAGGIARNGQNVGLYKANGTKAQLWKIIKAGASWRIASAVNTKYVLDVAGAQKKDGVNIQVYASNGTDAQKFFLLTTKHAAAGEKVLADGAYEIRSKAKTSYVLEIAGATPNNGGNAQIYKSNKTAAQKWQFTWDGKGYYTITDIASGKVLAVSGGKLVQSTNVIQWNSTNAASQKWVVKKNSDGSLTFINKATNLVLDIAGGKIANATNVYGWRSNGTAAQKWVVGDGTNGSTDTRVEYLNNGIYEIHPLPNAKVSVDIKGASPKSGAQTQVYTDNNSLAQRFQVVRVGKNQYKIRTAASGGWLTDGASGKTGVAVVQKGSSKTKASADTWEAFWNGSYFSLRNMRTGNVMDLRGGSTRAGATVQTYKANKTSAQHFRFESANLIDPGYYEIQSQLGRTLDIAGASDKNGANAQIYARNKSGAQKYRITKVGSNYRITNFYSSLNIMVNGSGNVLQGTSTGTNAQWKAEISDGGYVIFRNAQSGKVLDVAGGANRNGANVQQYAANGTKAQNWKPVKTDAYGWYKQNGHWFFRSSDLRARFDMDVNSNGRNLGHYDVLHDIWSRIKGYGSRTGYLLATSWDSAYLGVFKKTKAGWEPLYGWNVGVGSMNLVSSGIGRRWSGTYDYALALENVKGEYFEGDVWWASKLGSSFSDSRIRKLNHLEQYFTSIKAYLGYHTWLYSPNELGKQLSHGCTRLAYENAKWIFDTIYPGTRCLQIRTKTY